VDSPGTGTGTTIGASYAGAQDGQEYLRSLPQYALSKAYPYGTFAGGVFFGAQGVWIEDMATADAESYILIDHGGTTRTPPSQIEVKITSVESGDRCFVARTTGDNYIVDKGVFNIQVGAGASATEVRVEETIPNDTPTTGQLRIVRRNASGVIEGEDRVAYTSWDNDNQPTYSSFWTAATPNAIDTDDTAYVPFIDEQASSDEVSVLVQYTSNRTVVARVRYYNGAGDSIIPFQTKGPLNTGGYSTAAIRTPDSIVT
jgi:hypothetical protein